MEQEEKAGKQAEYYETNRDEISKINLDQAIHINPTVSNLSETQLFKLKCAIHNVANLRNNKNIFLAPGPYTLEEITAFETLHNIKLPLELSIYLTCISKATFKDHLHWQHVVLDKYSVNMMPTITSDKKYYNQVADDGNGDGNDDGNDDGNGDGNKNECDNTTKVLTIRNIGCGYSDVLIIDKEGDYSGQVWNEKFAGDGVFKKANDSFFDYCVIHTSN